MKKIFSLTLKFYALSSIFQALSESVAHAYIDPGTGSFILQAILGVIAVSAVTIKIYWKRIKQFCLRLIRKEPSENQK
jgi:hypothetical protein